MKSRLILFLIFLMVCPVLHADDEKPASDKPKDFDSGFKVALEVLKEMQPIEDPALVKRVNDIGYRVAQRSDGNMTNMSFRIVKMEEPNAFALPGGFIFVTSGMLDLDLTDDEMAALLGHEITHVKDEHSRKMGKRSTLVSLLYQALIVGIALGIKDNNQGYSPVTGMPTRSAKSEILQGSAAFGVIFQQLLLSGFSREYELDADHGGMIAASRAGFSPTGTTELFEKMRQKIYEAPGYGYWRSHPYLEDRAGIARSFAPTLEKSKNPADDTEFRKRTQQTFLKLVDKRKDDEEKRALKQMALNAYPKGPDADELRWGFIHDDEVKETTKEAYYRDYGKLVKMYQDNIQEMNQESESGELMDKLQKNLAQLKADRDAAMPLYEEILGKQIFDTGMLQRFLSNYPDNSRVPEIRYRLAENYRILKKNSDAVDLYLENLKLDDQNEWRMKSRESLIQLIPLLDDLTACYRIDNQTKDPDLKKGSSDRMTILAQSFGTLQNGYEFRRKYPASDYEKSVRTQMSKLAGDALNQAKLYQAVGEYQKALDHYNQILRYCSDLPVADQVKDSIIDFQELSEVKGT